MISNINILMRIVVSNNVPVINLLIINYYAKNANQIVKNANHPGIIAQNALQLYSNMETPARQLVKLVITVTKIEFVNNVMKIV